jgi:hypothetical protein
MYVTSLLLDTLLSPDMELWYHTLDTHVLTSFTD